MVEDELDKKAVTVRFAPDEFVLLKRVQDFYRTSSLAHAIRLGVVDLAKGIEAGNVTNVRSKPVKQTEAV